MLLKNKNFKKTLNTSLIKSDFNVFGSSLIKSDFKDNLDILLCFKNIKRSSCHRSI